MKDVFGTAILDYQLGQATEDIVTETSISEADILPIAYLFRNYSEMPELEQRALKMAKGSVLDVGCGAGNHSLFLQEQGFQVKSIDISEGAIKTCELRGVANAKVLAIDKEQETFDTILMLMNGSGFFKSLEETPKVLHHLKGLLNEGGQILIDSSDIKYMYEDEDGGYWIDANNNYYGELEYHVSYKGMSESFPWMYLDFENLKTACAIVGLECELVLEGPHYDFLARITT